MGNYEQLKAAVSAVIKTNGNQEITGAVMQNALLSIISTVGDNATFAGIATPDTNPGTPDQNVFYLAAQPGVYSNFGGVELTDQVLIFANKNGNWVKTDSGIATSAKVSELELLPYHVRGEVFNKNAQYVAVLPNGQGGTKKELNEIFRSIYISKKINKPYIERYFNNELIIKDEESNSYKMLVSFDNLINEEITIVGTFGDVQIIVVYNPGKRINGGFYNSTYEKTALSILDYSYFKERKSINKWIGEDGNPVDIATFATVQSISVKPGQKYRVKTSIGYSGSSMKRAYALYSNNVVSSDSFISGSNPSNKEILTDEVVEIPENCTMLAWSESSSEGRYAYIYCLSAIRDNKKKADENGIYIEQLKEGTPYNVEKSNFGVLPNTQGVSEEEAKNIFSEMVVSEDVKTYYINYNPENSVFTITLKKISNDEIYGTIEVNRLVDDYIFYPIVNTIYPINNKIIKGYAVLNAANIARASYGTYYVYFDGNEKVYKNKMSALKNIVEIILWGDSLTSIGSGYGEFFKYPGKITSDFGVGGENTLQILGRIGASPYLVRDDFTIPNNTDDEVSILLKSAWNGNNVMPRAIYGLNECTINGIKGTIKVTSEGNTATFKRSEPGEQFEVKAGTEVIPYYYNRVQTQFNVYWIGQNGGWDTPNELVEQFNTIAINQSNGMFLFITPHLNTSDELEELMQKTFGLRYINMRKWCVLYGLKASGISPTEADNEAIAAGNCPPSLLGDGVHFVESAKKAQAEMIENRIKELFDL